MRGHFVPQVTDTLMHPLDICNILAYGPWPGDPLVCGTHTGYLRIFSRESRYRGTLHPLSLDHRSRAYTDFADPQAIHPHGH
jgi:hypothetical protein